MKRTILLAALALCRERGGDDLLTSKHSIARWTRVCDPWCDAGELIYEIRFSE